MKKLRDQLNKTLRKKTKKTKDHVTKDKFKSDLRRDQVRQSNKLRKLAYNAEDKKAKSDLEVLNQEMDIMMNGAQDFLGKVENGEIDLDKSESE